MSLAKFGDFASFVKFLSFSAVGGITTYYLMNPRTKQPVTAKNLIVTTGCDSGLGYSLTTHCHDKLSMSVVACVHQLTSKGAVKLKDMFSGSSRFHMIELDVTKKDSIEAMKQFVKTLLDKNKDMQLTALVNNCGVMCFGETEWQTSELISEQIEVNLVGTIRVTQSFLPLIRQQRSRIINVTSHCGLQSLPGLPIYCATKSGLVAFTDVLRMDMSKYGIEVVNFIPGSFAFKSNILANQSKSAEAMRASMNKEQIGFYGEFFDRYYEYLCALAGDREPQMVDKNILETFEDALLDVPAKTRYICEPLRYKIYHLLFKMTPQTVTDYLLQKFIAMPEYDPEKSVKNG